MNNKPVSPHSFNTLYTRVNQQSYSSHYQSGAALIVVLLFLVLIMLGGVMAVRQSSTDLKTATADQINTLLLQSADSGQQKLESMINGNSSSSEYQAITSATGAFGHFITGGTDYKDHEFIYCYNPREKNYMLNNASVKIKDQDGEWSQANSGYCNYTDINSYTNARGTSLTQMSVSVTPGGIENEAFSHMVTGKEVENRTTQKYKFDVYATATLPAYNEPKLANKSCFVKSSIKQSDGTIPIVSCMKSANVPSKTLYQQADVENLSNSTKCIPFGTGSFDSSKCVLS